MMDNKVMSGIAVLAVALAALPPACSHVWKNAAESPAGGVAPAPGKTSEDVGICSTYDLVSVDGHAIPYAPMHGGQQAPRIASSTLTLNRDGTFVSTMSYGNPSGGTMSRDFKGTYTKDDAGHVLTWEGAGRTGVTIDGSTVTMNNEGVLFVYER